MSTPTKVDYVFGRYARKMPCEKRWLRNNNAKCGKPTTDYYYKVGESTNKVAVCSECMTVVKHSMETQGLSFKQAESDNKSRSDVWKLVAKRRR